MHGRSWEEVGKLEKGTPEKSRRRSTRRAAGRTRPSVPGARTFGGTGCENACKNRGVSGAFPGRTTAKWAFHRETGESRRCRQSLDGNDLRGVFPVRNRDLQGRSHTQAPVWRGLRHVARVITVMTWAADPGPVSGGVRCEPFAPAGVDGGGHDRRSGAKI